MQDTLIGESESVDDHRSGMTVVKLNGRLNKCGHAWTLEIESWTARLLPTLQIMGTEQWKLLVASRFFPPTLMHRPLFDGRR